MNAVNLNLFRDFSPKPFRDTMLKTFTHRMSDPGLEDWSEFKKCADKRYGVFKLPATPNTEYLVRAMSAVGNFYLLHIQKTEKKLHGRNRFKQPIWPGDN